MNAGRRKLLTTPVVIALNALFILAIAGLFSVFSTDYHDRLYAQNLETIASVNRTAANVAFNFYDNSRHKLRDIARYLDRHPMSFDAALAYICDSTDEDAHRLQLIRPDATGCLAARDDVGAFAALDYTAGDYDDLHQIFKTSERRYDIAFTPEFTDGYTARKVFALFTHVAVLGEDGAMTLCTLMNVSYSADAVRLLSVDDSYDNLSSVLIDDDGDYIIGNADFQSNNFFQYIYLCNGLSLDEKNALAADVAATGSGVMTYKDAHGNECVFAYARLQSNDWYCVSRVPVSSFRSFDVDIRLTVYIVGLLVLMMATNFVWLTSLNRRLRTSVEQERIANSAKTDFLSRMSHDIRTPLNAIIGMTALAKDEANPPETASALRDIEQSSLFLLGLVNDILDMNRVERGRMELHPEPYRCEEFLHYLRAVFAPLCAEKQITLTLDIKDAGRALMLDKLRVNQIFFNLLSNAVKFTPCGGHVSLLGEEEILPNGRVSTDITVSDDGMGMSEEFQARMYDAFTQENRLAAGSQPGSGLGLAIVRNLVSLMGGTIRVESREGHGTTFFVHMETDVAPESALSAQKSAGKQSLQGLHALLCEDNAINARIAVRMLERKGMTVDCAQDGQAGLERFSQSAPNTYDVVLMDIMMPVMDGLSATRAIRALTRPDAAVVPIVAMTANAFHEDIERSFAAGMNAHIAKPISPDKLFQTIAELTSA